MMQSEQRQGVLAEEVNRQTARGYRVLSQSDSVAVLGRGGKANHLLHLILSIITMGLWLPVWLVLGLVSKERRLVVTVDSDGNVRRDLS